MIMGWMMDEYSTIKRQYSPAVITGKPIPLGGSLGRTDATGRGIYYCIKELEKIKQWDPRDITVAVQVFGNVGSHVANFLFQDGYKIVAVSDSKGGIYHDQGFDIPSIIHTKNATQQIKAVYCAGSVCEDIVAHHITNEELLELPVDILIPSALENQITQHNAHNIQASVIVEGANGPTTPEADVILQNKKKLVIPDILANAGGVTVSYFEWVQNRSGLYWTEDEVHQRLKPMMQQEFSNVYKLHEKFSCSMRTASYVHALNRLNEAIAAQGTHEYFKDPALRT